ncbi:MAG: RNA-binding cell elongation regulator Jag/EloR [Dehalococcoidia bacterium]
MESVEVSAKNVEEAVELALKKLGANRDEVEVVVLEKGRPGFLGFGAEEARVRVIRHRLEEAERASATLAKEMLEKLLNLMKVSASVCVKEPSSSGEIGGRAPIALDITGEDPGILIGRRGNTLSSLQYLLYLMVSHQMKARVLLSVDVESYRDRREEALKNLALRMAERVRASGHSVTLEPMSPSERRIIHLALQDHPEVITQSIGEGESRKVTIQKGSD